MDTRRSAGSSALEVDDSVGFLGEGVGQQIVSALRANLERGFFESEERFQQITEALHDVVALSDEQYTRLYFVNAAYEQIWGRPRQDLYANPLAFLDGVHVDDRERVRAAIVGASGAEYDVEFRVVRPDGELRWVWSRGFPVRDESGAIFRVASITEDITDRRRVVESHERLIRGFTHDVKNPLGAADGYMSLLEIGVFGELTATQLESVGNARRSIHTALDLVGQLLDIERAEAGQVQFERERVDIGAVTGDIVEEFRATADAKRLSLALLIPERGENDTLVVESDRARLRQILANLISNAVKYTQPNGSIVVTARVATDGEAPRDGRWVAIGVADNGPGIPLEKQNLIFREFTRFNPRAAEGSGIGLAISQRLAHMLGATITFKSVVGEGSTFTLWLPSDSGLATHQRSVSVPSATR